MVQVPNTSNDQDPAWGLSAPDRQWWGMAELDNYPVPGLVPGKARLAWSMPTPSPKAEAMIGVEAGEDWIWEPLPPRLATELANRGHRYLQNLEDPEERPVFLNNLADVLIKPGGGLADESGGSPLSRQLARIRFAPPRDTWLDEFDRLHRVAEAGSARATRKHIKEKRPFQDRAQTKLHRNIWATKAGTWVSTGLFGGFSAQATTAMVHAYEQGLPEFVVSSAAAATFTAFLAGGFFARGLRRARRLRGKLAESLGVPGLDSPT
ncbi:MAG: hypothetical protein ACRDPW_00055, partial [Mycobacteriales bacterium]